MKINPDNGNCYPCLNFIWHEISRVRTPNIILVPFWSFYLLPNTLLLLLFTPSSPTRVNDRDTVVILRSSSWPDLLLKYHPLCSKPSPKVPFLSPWGLSNRLWLVRHLMLASWCWSRRQVIGRGSRHVTACDCGPGTAIPGPPNCLNFGLTRTKNNKI